MTAIRLTELDADLAMLTADYAARRGLARYSHKALLTEMYPIEKPAKTERYPTPDSQRRAGNNLATTTRRKPAKGG